MGRLQVKKIVVSCFLEAAKLATEQCSTYRMQLSEKGKGSPADLPRLYGDLRQLRDYLQRCSSTYQESVELDLADSGVTLLVATCRRFVDWLDHQLQGVIPDVRERQFLVKKRQLVSDWALELAQKPLLELPMPKCQAAPGEGGRALHARLQEKLFAVSEQRMIRDGKSTLIGGSLGGSAGSTSQTMGAPLGFDFGPLPAEPEPELAAPPKPQDPSADLLFDTSRLRDPRLRALAGMDLRSLRFASQARDHRAMSLFLGAALETALLDHALPRRADLGLHGKPESWEPIDLVLKVLGDSVQPSDPAQAYNLFCLRALLSPARQLATPLVVTESSVQRMIEFAERVLQVMGLKTSGQAADLFEI